ncbi:MAG: hypothetical protein RR188_01580 [Eubacterium sp.]
MDSEKDKMKNKAAYDFKGIKTTCDCLKMEKNWIIKQEQNIKKSILKIQRMDSTK